MAARTYTLYAMETPDSGPIEQLLDRVAEAVVDVTVDGMAIGGKQRVVHSIILDAARMRDTVAAGHAYAAGYVSHTA